MVEVRQGARILPMDFDVLCVPTDMPGGVAGVLDEIAEVAVRAAADPMLGGIVD